MTKRGYHRLITPSGEVLNQVIVEFEDDGKIVGWHTFRREEAGVEWMGGTLDQRMTSS